MRDVEGKIKTKQPISSEPLECNSQQAAQFLSWGEGRRRRALQGFILRETLSLQWSPEPTATQKRRDGTVTLTPGRRASGQSSDLLQIESSSAELLAGAHASSPLPAPELATLSRDCRPSFSGHQEDSHFPRQVKENNPCFL